MQGGATCRTTAEIRAFFNAQFQSCVISCKAKVKWLPYSPTQPPLILLILHHDLLAQRKAVNYQWTEKNLQGHGTHDSRADDPRPSGQYPQKMQCPQTSWRRPLWVIFSVPIKTVLNSLSGASFIFFLWTILFELCSHSRCQLRKIILYNRQIWLVPSRPLYRGSTVLSFLQLWPFC